MADCVLFIGLFFGRHCLQIREWSFLPTKVRYIASPNQWCTWDSCQEYLSYSRIVKRNTLVSFISIPHLRQVLEEMFKEIEVNRRGTGLLHQWRIMGEHFILCLGTWKFLEELIPLVSDSSWVPDISSGTYRELLFARETIMPLVGRQLFRTGTTYRTISLEESHLWREENLQLQKKKKKKIFFDK